MRLYDTFSHNYRDFNPTQPVKMYVCGITPYAAAHLGHAFTFLTYDLLQRRLEDQGLAVTMVRNITDVDEPLFAKAQEMEVDYRDLAAAEIEAFDQAMEQFNIRQDTLAPRASQYIDQMAAAVQQLLNADIAYRLGDDIYFDTATQESYGHILGFRSELADNFARLRGGNPDLAGKRQPADFLLWKGLPDQSEIARWDSPVGPGRPGWHIECSVMSQELLGNSFDIHGGGSDLIYPHHAAEIAQSTALHGVTPAKIWLHTAPILLAGEKMSKSLGNLIFLTDLMEQSEPAVVRLALMHYHHRIGGEWIDHLLQEAARIWFDLQRAGRHASNDQAATVLQEVRDCLDDDINTTEVIDALNRFTKKVSIKSDEHEPPHAYAQLLTLLGLQVN